MDHIVSVGLDGAALKQLDDLRRAHPNVPSRSEIIKRLIWTEHAKIAAPKSAPDLAG
jgi:metal-responsive CopG/Arc/MetJ family transcriptional regulator